MDGVGGQDLGHLDGIGRRARRLTLGVSLAGRQRVRPRARHDDAVHDGEVGVGCLDGEPGVLGEHKPSFPHRGLLGRLDDKRHQAADGEEEKEEEHEEPCDQ